VARKLVFFYGHESGLIDALQALTGLVEWRKFCERVFRTVI
jgi:hypothetical protein